MRIKKPVLKYAPIPAIACIACFFILPSTFQLITYFIPVVYLSVLFSRDGRGFNELFFIFLLILTIFVPTGFFTLDASIDVENLTAELIPSTSPNLDMIWSWKDFVNLIVIILFIVFPAIAIFAAIYAFFMREIEQGLRTIYRIMIAILALFGSHMILDFFGILPNWYFWTYIRDFVIWIVEFFKWAGESVLVFFINLIEGIQGKGFNKNYPDFPDLTEFGFGSFSLQDRLWGDDASFTLPENLPITGNVTLDAENPMNPLRIFPAINAAIPLILSGVLFVLWFSYRAGHNPYIVINGYFAREKDKQQTLKITGLKFNVPAMIFAVMILVFAFGSFLHFTDTGFDTGIYTIISIFCLVIIIMGILPIKTGNIRNFTEGTAYGVGGIMLFYNLLSAGLSVINSPQNNVVVNVLNQIFYVAPTESLIFHIVIPSIGIAGTYFAYQRFTKRNKIDRLDKELLNLNIRKVQFQELFRQLELKGGKGSVKYQGKSFTQSQLSLEINNIDIRIQLKELDRSKEATITLNTLLLSKVQYLALTIVLSFVVPNIVFSTYHLLRSTSLDTLWRDMLNFWASGIGFVYFSSGCWLTLISIRFGWLSCISSHALINIITILMFQVRF